MNWARQEPAGRSLCPAEARSSRPAGPLVRPLRRLHPELFRQSQFAGPPQAAPEWTMRVRIIACNSAIINIPALSVPDFRIRPLRLQALLSYREAHNRLRIKRNFSGGGYFPAKKSCKLFVSQHNFAYFCNCAVGCPYGTMEYVQTAVAGEPKFQYRVGTMDLL